MAKQKLQTELSLRQKSEVLLRIQKGESQCKLAEQYGVSKTTIANTKKNEHSVTNAVESNCSQNRKWKMRKTENEEVNNIILEFFIKFRAQNIPVTGPMLQAKAAEIASSLQIEKFTASNGWLEAFRHRNNINFRALCGESANVDKEAADDWKRLLLKDMPQKTNSTQMKLPCSTGNSQESQWFSEGNHAKVESSLKRD